MSRLVLKQYYKWDHIFLLLLSYEAHRKLGHQAVAHRPHMQNCQDKPRQMQLLHQILMVMALRLTLIAMRVIFEHETYFYQRHLNWPNQICFDMCCFG
jgi:hypothetical protein